MGNCGAGVEVGSVSGVFVANFGAQAVRMNEIIINKNFLYGCFINLSIKHLIQAMAFWSDNYYPSMEWQSNND
jgi:hypothetical protein